MIEIKIENKKFTLPIDWTEVTFKQFINIISVQNDNLNSEIESFVKILTALSDDKTMTEYLNQMSIDDFNKLKGYFNWLFDDFDPKKHKSNKKFFEIDGEKWKIKEDFNKLSVGEMVSLEIMIKDSKLDLTPYEIAFGILFRKVDENGKEEKFNADDMINIILNHSNKIYVTDVINQLDFFLDGDQTSTTKNSQVSFQVLEKGKKMSS